MWFVIEIFSFYGYILAAIIYIAENMIASSLGLIDKSDHKERYKYDFLSYHRDDLHWFAFVVILFTVNISLVLMDNIFIFNSSHKHTYMTQVQIKDHDAHPLFYLQVVLLVNHFI